MQARTDAHGQKLFDFDGSMGQRKMILRLARIPAGEVKDGKRRAKVSPAILKGVLRVIEDHLGSRAECWLTHATIGSEAGVSERTARRACDALENLGYLICQRKPIRFGSRRTCNHYRIVWTDLGLLVPVNDRQKIPTGGDQTSTDPDQTSTDPDQTSTDPDQTSTSGQRNLLFETTKKPPPPNLLQETIIPDGPAWAEAEEGLSAIGIGSRAECLRMAAQRGIEPAEILYALDVYRANREILRNPGAVWFWLEQGAWPAAGVREPDVEPPPAPRPIPDDDQTDRRPEHVLRAEAERDRRELDELDNEWGRELDGLGASDLHDLASHAGVGEWELTLYLRTRTATSRAKLLRELSRQSAKTPCQSTSLARSSGSSN